MTSQSFEVCLPSAANGLPFAEISDLRRMGIMAIDPPDAGNPFNSSEALRAIQELGGDSISLQQACDAATFLQSWHPGGDRAVADTLVRDHGWEHSRAKAAMRLVVLIERTPLFNALGNASDNVGGSGHDQAHKPNVDSVWTELGAVAQAAGMKSDLQSLADAMSILESNMPRKYELRAILVRDKGWSIRRFNDACKLAGLFNESIHSGDDSGAPEPTSRDSGQRHETEKPLDDALLSNKPESVRADNAPSSAELVGTDATAMSAPQPEKAPPSSVVPRKPGVLRRNRNESGTVRPIPERAKSDGAVAAHGKLPCASRTELFTESKGRQILEAKELCIGCKEQADCAAKALAMRDTVGVFGGLVPAERRKIHARAKTAITQARARLDGAFPPELYKDLSRQVDSVAYPAFIRDIVKSIPVQETGGDLFKPITEALSDEEIIDAALQQAFEAYDRERQRNTKRKARLAILASLEDESVAS